MMIPFDKTNAAVFTAAMPDLPPSPKRATSRTGLLPRTPWTRLMRSRGGDTAAEEALGQIVGLYWRPIHICIQKRGFAEHDAEDLTQEFLTRIVRQGTLERADPAKGRLRSYLLKSLNFFLQNAWRARGRQRRGGQVEHLSLGTEDALEVPDLRTPEAEFDLQWVLAVLDNVLNELREDYASQGKSALFEALSPAITAGEGEIHPEEAGRALGMSAGAVRVAVHRLRLRYRNLLHRHIAATVESEEEVEAEIRALISMLKRDGGAGG